MNEIASKIILNHPYRALRVNTTYITKERVYGVVKRLAFFVTHIEREREWRKLAPTEIKVLDVGCGTGADVTIPLANASYTIVGIDPDLLSIEYGKQIALESALSNVEFYCSSLDRAQLPGPFHVVICSEVLEHLEKPDSLIRQMHALLVDEGLLLITVPNGYSYFEVESILWRRFPRLDSLAAWLNTILTILIQKFDLSKRKPGHTMEAQKSTFVSTLASDQHHLRLFTFGQVCHIFDQEQFSKVEFRNNIFLAGNIIQRLVHNMDWFLKLNCWIADFLPHWLCSDWLFALRKGSRK